MFVDHTKEEQPMYRVAVDKTKTILGTYSQEELYPNISPMYLLDNLDINVEGQEITREALLYMQEELSLIVEHLSEKYNIPSRYIYITGSYFIKDVIIDSYANDIDILISDFDCWNNIVTQLTEEFDRDTFYFHNFKHCISITNYNNKNFEFNKLDIYCANPNVIGGFYLAPAQIYFNKEHIVCSSNCFYSMVTRHIKSFGTFFDYPCKTLDKYRAKGFKIDQSVYDQIKASDSLKFGIYSTQENEIKYTDKMDVNPFEEICTPTIIPPEIVTKKSHSDDITKYNYTTFQYPRFGSELVNSYYDDHILPNMYNLETLEIGIDKTPILEFIEPVKRFCNEVVKFIHKYCDVMKIEQIPEEHIIVTGGFISSLLRNKPSGDIDIIINDKKHFSRFKETIRYWRRTRVTPFDCVKIYDDIYDNHGYDPESKEYNLFKSTKDVFYANERIVGGFYFAPSQIYYHNGVINCSSNCLYSILTSRIISYGIMFGTSFKRILKYAAKGYKFTNEYLELAKDVFIDNLSIIDAFYGVVKKNFIDRYTFLINNFAFDDIELM